MLTGWSCQCFSGLLYVWLCWLECEWPPLAHRSECLVPVVGGACERSGTVACLGEVCPGEACPGRGGGRVIWYGFEVSKASNHLPSPPSRPLCLVCTLRLLSLVEMWTLSRSCCHAFDMMSWTLTLWGHKTNQVLSFVNRLGHGVVITSTEQLLRHTNGFVCVCVFVSVKEWEVVKSLRVILEFVSFSPSYCPWIFNIVIRCVRVDGCSSFPMSFSWIIF